MDNFVALTDLDRAEMLKTIGVLSVEDLFKTIPQQARISGLNLSDGLSELEAQVELNRLSKLNNTDLITFLGGGAQKRFVPACISQIAQRFEFITAYTPYQPEISQGTLQIIYEFQSMICNITGMDVSNASVYDGATACAEAVLMSARITGNKKALVSNSLNPEYKAVVETYCDAMGIEVEYFQTLDEVAQDICSVLIQTPNYFGEIEDLASVKEKLGAKTLFIVAQDPVYLGLLKPPSEYGVDIVVGDVQGLGIALNFGGPYGGFIACLDKHKRQICGRVVGRTLDADGNQAFTLTLQTREQHIRREKATSNICSNQALVALCATVYLTVMGKDGFKQVSYLSAKNAHLLVDGLKELGVEVLSKNFFSEFVIKVCDSDEFLSKMRQNGIVAGLKISANEILVSASEVNTKSEIEKYIETVKNERTKNCCNPVGC